MVTLTKDLIEGTINNVRADSRYGLVFYGTRAFMARGLTNGSVNQSASALARSLASVGLPQIGGNPYPEDFTIAPNCVILNYRSQGVRESDDAALLFADYDTPILPATPALFTISDDSSLMQSQRQLLPGTGEPFRQTFQYTDPTASHSVPRTATLPIMMPIRKMVLSGPIANRDLDTYRNKLATVNDASWRGLPLGYWLFTAFRSVRDTAAALLAGTNNFQTPVNGPIDRATVSNMINNPDQKFNASVELESKVIEDWSLFSLFVDPRTGETVQVNSSIAISAYSDVYDYGVFDIGTDGSPNGGGAGLLVVGPYQLSSFSALFGM